MVEDLKADLEVTEKRLLHVFKIEKPAVIHNMSLGLCSCDLFRRELLQASMSETAVHFFGEQV